MVGFLFESMFDIFGKAIFWALDSIMACFNTTPDQFREIIPALEHIPGVLTAIGWTMLLLLLVISTIKSIMSPNDQMAEHPLSLVGRTVIAGLFLLTYEKLFEYFFSWGTAAYNLIGATSIAPTGPDATPFSAISEVFTKDGIGGVLGDMVINVLGGAALSVVGLILLLLIAWQLIKFMLECLERFVTLHLSVYFAPLVAPTLGSKTTSTIFSSYLSFVMGQMMLWWMSMLFLKLIASGFDAFGQQDDGVGFLLRYFVLFTLTALAQKADNILARLGFKNILGGAGTSAGFMYAMMVAGRTVGRSIKSVVGAGKGKTGGSPQYDPNKSGGNGEPRVKSFSGSEPGAPQAVHIAAAGQQGPQSESFTNSANAAKEAAAEKQAKAEMLKQEAERIRTDHSKEQSENTYAGDGIAAEGSSGTEEGANIDVNQDGATVGDVINGGNISIPDNAAYDANALTVQGSAMENLAQADTCQASSFVAMGEGDRQAAGAAMSEAQGYVAVAAETYADGIRGGTISSIPADSGIVISEDGQRAIYTGAGGEAISTRIDPYAFMPKDDARQIATTSGGVVQNIENKGLHRGNDQVSQGYQALRNAHRDNVAAVDASIKGDHAMAREFHIRAENGVHTAATHFSSGGARGYEAARSAGIALETKAGGNVSYTATGPLSAKGRLTGTKFKSKPTAGKHGQSKI